MYGADANAGGDNTEATFQITSTKLYVPIVTLSTKDNVNLDLKGHCIGMNINQK